MSGNWYYILKKGTGLVWCLIGVLFIDAGLTRGPDPAVLFVYMGDVILLGGLALIFSIDEAIKKRDMRPIVGYLTLAIGTFVVLFGYLSVLEPESVLVPQWVDGTVSWDIIILGSVAVLLGAASLYSPMSMKETLIGLFAIGAGFIVLFSVLYTAVFSMSIPRIILTLAILLVTAAAAYLVSKTNFKSPEEEAVILMIPLTLILFTNTLYLQPFVALVVALAIFVIAATAVYLSEDVESERRVALALAFPLVLLLFMNFVLLTPSPSYDNTTMAVGPEGPPCMNSYSVTFNEEKSNLENETVGNYTEEELKEVVLKDLGLEGNNSKRKSVSYGEMTEELARSLNELEGEDNLTEDEKQMLRAFRDALEFESNDDGHYPPQETRVERIPHSTNISKVLKIVEEEYGINDPTIINGKPRYVKFGREKIDVKEKFAPDKYYVIEGIPEDNDYERKQLLVVREGPLFTDTRLVRFQMAGYC